MGETTGIQWTDATWNPWRGCHKISPACARCYMFRDQIRYGRDPNVVVRASDSTFYAPLKWKEPKRIFTCSWSDFFIEEADRWRTQAFAVMLMSRQHTYQILTKRPERMRNWMCGGRGISELSYLMQKLVSNIPNSSFGIHHWADGLEGFCIDNSWLGVSVENSRWYSRIEELIKTPAIVRFLSIEPLLGPMPDIPLDGINWVIVGGESGPKFRPLNLDWVRQIRDRCLDKGVAFFFKQHSGLHPKKFGRLLDGREWNDIPNVKD